MKFMHALDATQQLQDYQSTPNIFHTLGYKPTAGAVIFNKHSTIKAPLILSHSKKLSIPSLDVYNVCIGHVAGLSIGFLFHSPLELKSDFFYLVFHRKNVNVQKMPVLEKRFVAENLIMYSNESVHYIVPRGLSARITNYCSKR